MRIIVVTLIGLILAMPIQVLGQANRPRLDCVVKTVKSPASNNFTVAIPAPAGYELVTGTCAFDNWQMGDNPVLIQVGPNDDKGNTWYCYAKQSRADTFTTRAKFCRVVNN